MKFTGGCTDCNYFHSYHDGDYGGGPLNTECSNDEVSHLQNLRTFPFKKIMPCFVANFWTTDFANLVNPDLGDDRENRILDLFKKTDRFGKLHGDKDLREFEKLKREYYFDGDDHDPK